MRGIECAFIGILSKGLEVKQAKNGQPYCNFSCSVAAPAGASPRSAASSEAGESQWINVICFGAVAEELVQHAHKGDTVYVEGHLSLAKWENAGGEARSGLAVSAWKAEKLGCIGRNRVLQPDEDKPALPIALPTIRKKKRPAFGMFRKKKKALAQDSADKSQYSSENGRQFDDALPF